MKIVINARHGGFGLSAKATEQYLARKGKNVWWFKTARTPEGGLDFDRVEPTDSPDRESCPFSYTSPGREEGSYFASRDIPRDDPDLIAVVEQLGIEANGRFAELRVVEIPDDVDWEIAEYDGSEWVAEKHRTWS